MLVKKWMRKEVLTVDIRDSMMDAAKKMKEHDIRRLPVLKKGALVGIVTDRDLKRSSASDANSLEFHELLYLLSEIMVGEIMTKDPITVPLDYTVEETAEILLENKISGVPVVDQAGQLAGIITQSDIFRVLISLTGEKTKGIQVAFISEDRPGSIKEVTDIIRNYDGRMVSILSTYKGMPEGYRKVYIRLYGLERDRLENMKEEINEKATLLYVIDHRENRREILEEAYREITRKWDNVIYPSV